MKPQRGLPRAWRGRRTRRLPFATVLLTLFIGGAYLILAPGGAGSSAAAAAAGGGLGGQASVMARRRLHSHHNHTGAALGEGCHPLKPWEEKTAGIVAYTALLVYAFVGLAIVCDDFFVAALEQISEHLQLSDDVAGATFMAAGSSAPELFVSLADNVLTEPGKAIGIGTIIGSAIFNICVIIAVTSVLAGKALKLDWRPMARDSTWYTVSIGVLFWAVEDREVDAAESVVLLCGYVGYIVFMVHNEKWMGAIGNALGDSSGWNQGAGGDGSGQGADGEEQGEEGAGGGGAIEMATTTGGSSVAAPAMLSLTVTKKAALDAGAPEEDPTMVHTLHGRGAAAFANHSTDADDAVMLAGEGRTKRTPSAANPLHGSANRAFNTRRSLSTEGGDAAKAAAAAVAAGGFSDVDLEGAGGSAAGGGDDDEEELGGYWDPITVVPGTVAGVAWWLLTLPLSLGFKLTIPDCRFARWKTPRGFTMTFVMSIVWIGGLTFAVVHAVEKVGCALSIPFPLLALTVVAAGTSIPDALSSVLVAREGQGDMAVSNAIGSNIFDIFLGLGLPFLLSNFIYGKPVRVGTGDDYEELIISICILLGTVVAVVLIIKRANWVLEPKVGGALFLIYIGYVIFAYLYNEGKK